MDAIISDCGKYRYVLRRKIPQPIRWVKSCLFIMLNPSTADASVDDPTIRRCVSFAKKWGCTDMTVVNLFALRSRNPADLLTAVNPIGPENSEYVFNEIITHQLSHNIIVVAWGNHKMAQFIAGTFKEMFMNAKCLGKNKNGSPKHPLYIKTGQELEDWP